MRLAAVERPQERRWQFVHGEDGLQVVSPRGKKWEFKLCRGAWMRPAI
jgi:hypothetical protein